MSNDGIIWHLLAQDVHMTHRILTSHEGVKSRIEVMHFYAEKKFFDSRESVREYVAWHLRQYNAKLPHWTKISREELYSVVKIDTKILKNYESVFLESLRKRVGKSEYCPESGLRSIPSERIRTKYDKKSGIEDIAEGVENTKNSELRISRLTAQDALEIRRRYANEDIKQQELAIEYGVSSVVIGNVINKKTWKYI